MGIQGIPPNATHIPRKQGRIKELLGYDSYDGGLRFPLGG